MDNRKNVSDSINWIDYRHLRQDVEFYFLNEFGRIPKIVRALHLYDSRVGEIEDLIKEIKNEEIIFSHEIEGKFIFKKNEKTPKLDRSYIIFNVDERKMAKIVLGSNGSISIYMCGDSENVIDDFLKKIEKIVLKQSKKNKDSEEQKIFIACMEYGEMTFKEFPLKQVKINLETNYGKNFKEVHEEIINKLSNNESGLFIFRGDPGSGKSSYIKYLTSIPSISDRNFIFIPSSMVASMADPSFIALLSQQKGRVLIIEDAEKIITSREANVGNSDLVSTIINLTDGILSSALGISVILTFNTGKENIDPALLRKGRLLVDHDFRKLTKEEAQLVMDDLKIDAKAEDEMTLAEIYNLDKKDYRKNFAKEQKGPIGFKP